MPTTAILGEPLSPAYDQWFKQVEAQAKAIGAAQGKAIGEARGTEIGRQEERLSIARNMLKEGSTIALIVKVTGLSQAEVEALQ